MGRKDSVWTNRTGGYIETTRPSGYDVLINGTDKYLNWGILSGSTGYGIRDNAGIMEWKNSGGNWGALGSASWGSITGTLSDQTDLQTALDGKIDENTSITGATKTKITYDAKGLVTGGADATTADIADSTNKRYVTDANLTVIGNTSGTNTGDNAVNSLYSGLVSNATHTGDATGDTVLTLATVNSNIGTFNNITINAKGLATAGSNIAYLTSVGTGVANELTYWSGVNTLGSLATATYPSLTELSYVKGLTSAAQTQLEARELLTNKSTDTTLGTSDTLYPSQKAVKTYVDNAVVGLLDYRGAYDASVNTFPASGGSGTAGAILKGDMWIISVAGTLGGVAVGVGDSVIANTDTPGQTSTNWNVLDANISYVPENVANKVTSISGASTDTQYPSAKLTYDQLALKQATITFGTGVQTALGVNIGSAGAPVLFNGALGTPSSGNLTNATGLPAASVLAGTFGTGAYTMDTSLTVPILNGSSAANGDITINGTSNATKTSSYVILQATGGNVGIGTTTPDNKLAVLGGIGTGMSFYNTAAPARANFHLTAGIVGYTNNALALSENYDGVEYYHLTTFAKNLYLGGKSNVVSPASVTILNGQGKTDILNVNSTSPFVIQAGGNVGIGTTAPAAAFELASGGLYVSNYGSGVSVPGGGSIGMYLRGATSTSPFGFSAAGTGNISATAPLFYYSWVGASATKLGFSSYDTSAIKDYIAFDYATGNFEVKAPAIEATSSTTIGTTTLADKFGNAYLTNGADIYPDNDIYGLWNRFVNYGFTPDEHWGQNADELTWTGWATYTSYVTPASITTNLSSYSVAHNSGVKSAFRYRSAATGAAIFLRARAAVTFLNTGGVMIDDGTDTGDGNGANNFYRVYIKQTALAGAFQVFEEYRTGGGAVTTNTGPTIAYGQFSGIGLLTQGTRWTSWTAAPFTFGEAQSYVQFTGGTAAMSWTPVRVGLYAKFSATDFGRRAIWDWYDEATS